MLKFSYGISIIFSIIPILFSCASPEVESNTNPSEMNLRAETENQSQTESFAKESEFRTSLQKWRSLKKVLPSYTFVETRQRGDVIETTTVRVENDYVVEREFKKALLDGKEIERWVEDAGEIGQHGEAGTFDAFYLRCVDDVLTQAENETVLNFSVDANNGLLTTCGVKEEDVYTAALQLDEQ